MSLTIPILQMKFKEFNPEPLGLYINRNQELVLDPQLVSVKKYVDDCPHQEERKARRKDIKVIFQRYGFQPTQVMELDFSTFFISDKICSLSGRNCIVMGSAKDYHTIVFYDFDSLINWLKKEKKAVYRQWIQMTL